MLVKVLVKLLVKVLVKVLVEMLVNILVKAVHAESCMSPHGGWVQGYAGSKVLNAEAAGSKPSAASMLRLRLRLRCPATQPATC